MLQTDSSQIAIFVILLAILEFDQSSYSTMAALDYHLAELSLHYLSQQQNWAARDPGVILMLCIVVIVVILLTALFIHTKIDAKRAARA
jgi:hypothetical protein